MHDVFTREFVNVGVLLHAPDDSFLGFEMLSTLDRVKRMFPSFDSGSLDEMLSFLGSRAEEIHSEAYELHAGEAVSAESIAISILPRDDSSLQWSPPGGGITDEPRASLKDLCERVVTRHLHP